MPGNKLSFGEIRWVKFDGKGCMLNNYHPAVIVQNELGCIHSPIVQVIPLTGNIKKAGFPTHVLIPKSTQNGLSKDSVALVEQKQPVDKGNIKGLIGNVEKEYILELGEKEKLNCPMFR